MRRVLQFLILGLVVIFILPIFWVVAIMEDWRMGRQGFVWNDGWGFYELDETANARREKHAVVH